MRVAPPLLIALVTLAACGRAAATRSEASPSTATSAAGPLQTASPIEALVRSAALATYWHADRPGRVPVRLVAHPHATDRPAFAMFGAPVRWIERAEATAGSAFVEVDFTLTDGVLTLRAGYPIEGVVASATFFPDGAGGWFQVGATKVVET